MQIRYNPTANTAYITLRPGHIDRTEDVGDGYALDYDVEGQVLGIEVPSVTRTARGELTIMVPDRIWETADSENYDWGPEGRPDGKSLEYVPGTGWVLEEDD